MFKIVRLKFKQNKHLAKRLLDTDDALLIEGNTWHDNYWGDCKCSHPKCSNKGRNALGEILMEIRDEIKNLTST